MCICTYCIVICDIQFTPIKHPLGERRRRHREEDIQDEMMRIAETRLLFDPQTTILAYESINWTVMWLLIAAELIESQRDPRRVNYNGNIKS